MTSPSETGTPAFVAWALAYAAKGWPVFPLVPGNKTPLTQTGFKEATLAPDQIMAWWHREPESNIGVRTGVAFDVLDVDGPEGAAFLRTWLAARGKTYRHDGPVGVTGKGWHFLFAPTGRRNGANLGGDGEKGPDNKLLRPSKIDFRGDGGYIVAPPSLHPLGHRYQWDWERGAETPLPAAPTWLTELLDDTGITDQPTEAVRKEPPVPNWVLDILKTEAIPRGTPAYEELMKHLPRQARARLDRPDILDVCAKRGVKLRRAGKVFKGLCPLHNETTPSFTVYPDDNTFYCFGCNTRGDSYDLQEPQLK